MLRKHWRVFYGLDSTLGCSNSGGGDGAGSGALSA
jgi:hypothetical protein